MLSGADGDGAIGLKRIKERGGLTVVQNPEEAEHDGMPRSALATGMVDWVLNIADMPPRILQYQESESLLRLPAEDGPQPAQSTPPSHDEDEQALRETLVLLRSRTSHDFTYYKRATILRRISRRMQINGITTLPGYLTFLRSHLGESGALLQDLLISVTNFFRDREAFAAVEKEIPALFADKGPGDVVRVWTAACATGEETYSFAMMLIEHARTLEHPPAIQVFGCDLDAAAIQTARAGIYPPSIVADVSEGRIQRFFTKDVRGYRVRRELRETVLFAEHDLLKDAPFSRMDLISCRNLLIYFDREAQDRAMDIFHFALRPKGRLFLGGSENVDESRGLFASLDQKHRIFLRQPALRIGLPVPTGTATLLRAMQAQNKEAPMTHGANFARGVGVPLHRPAQSGGADERAALTELHFQMLEHFAPPSARDQRAAGHRASFRARRALPASDGRSALHGPHAHGQPHAAHGPARRHFPGGGSERTGEHVRRPRRARRRVQGRGPARDPRPRTGPRLPGDHLRHARPGHGGRRRRARTPERGKRGASLGARGRKPARAVARHRGELRGQRGGLPRQQRGTPEP